MEESSDRSSNSGRICIFIRHGEAENNVKPTWSTDLDRFSLTEEGEKGVEKAGAQLLGAGRIDSLYTSPILRARQTADIISRYIRLSPKKNNMLVERSFGKYNNVNINSREERIKVLDDQIDRGYPDWESFDGLAYRMMKFSESIKEGEVAVAVTHMDPIKSLIGHFLNKDERSVREIRPGNSSFTIIDFAKRGKEAILLMCSPEIPKGYIGK